MYFCYKCHNEVNLEVKPTRFDVCDFCSASLRCCYNCKYYDPGATNECREPNSAYIADQSAGNFCGFFLYIEGKGHLHHVDKKDIQSKFENLFRKK